MSSRTSQSKSFFPINYPLFRSPHFEFRDSSATGGIACCSRRSCGMSAGRFFGPSQREQILVPGGILRLISCAHAMIVAKSTVDDAHSSYVLHATGTRKFSRGRRPTVRQEFTLVLEGCPPHPRSPLFDVLQLVTNLKDTPRKIWFGSVINKVGPHFDNAMYGWGRSHRSCGKTCLSG